MKSVHLSTAKCPCTMLIALPPASVLTSSLSSPGPDSSSSVSRFWKTCYSSSTALPGRPAALRLAAMTSPQVVKSKEKPAELGGRSGPPGSPAPPRGRHRRSTHLSVPPGGLPVTTQRQLIHKHAATGKKYQDSVQGPHLIFP